RGHLILPVLGIMGPVPWKGGSLDMRHGRQMPSRPVTEHGHIVVTAVGICGIVRVTVFGHDLILVLRFGEPKFTFPMADPYPQGTSGQGGEHHRVVLLDLYRGEI